MAVVTTYEFKRGETILLSLDVVEGAPADVAAVSAGLQIVPAGAAAPDPSAPANAVFAVQFQPAAGTVPARWCLTIDAAASLLLPLGLYHAAAKVTLVAGGVFITDAVAVRLVKSVAS